jgi:hypothetical protein
LNPILFQGAVLADFDLFDVTNSAPVVIEALAELPAGTYTITQTLVPFVPGDVYRISVDKLGFIGSVEFTAI